MAEPPNADVLAPTGSDRLWDSSVGGDVAFLLARANALSLSRAHDALAATGLPVRAFCVLSIAAEDKRPSQRELAEFLRLDPSLIVAVIDGLERDGLVRRDPDPTDRRAKVVVATPAGLEVHRQARLATKASEERMLGDLDAEQLSTLVATLRSLAGAE